MTDLVIGVDIGGTKTKLGLVDSKGECFEKTTFRTREYPDLEDFLDKIKDTADKMVKGFGRPVNLLGCGVGAPNASSKMGTIENASNLLWKGSVPLVKKLGERMDMPIQVMNDANAAALGEMLFGGAKGM